MKTKFISFFKELHKLVTNQETFICAYTYGTLKHACLFFIIIASMSLVLSTASRCFRIIHEAPRMIFEAVGAIEFENYQLIQPQKTIIVDSWRLKEFTSLFSGFNTPDTFTFPITVSIGEKAPTDTTTTNAYIHFGTDSIFAKISFKPSTAQAYSLKQSWTDLLPSPHLSFDSTQSILDRKHSLIPLFFMEFFILGTLSGQFLAHFWFILFLYLLFFAREIKGVSRLKVLLYATIPYFLLLPIAMTATRTMPYLTDISLVLAIVLVSRAFLFQRFQEQKLRGDSK